MPLVLALLACTSPTAEDSTAPTDDSSGPVDCLDEGVEDPMNGAGGGAWGPTTVTGAACAPVADEFTVNVSTGCDIKAVLRFDEERDDEDNLIADGTLEVLWYASYDVIGEVGRIEDGDTVTLTMESPKDSYGAVRVRVTNTVGERLDYTLVLQTCTDG